MLTGNMISTLVLTPIPSPYQVELFDAVEAAGSIRLRILYAAPSFPDRLWKVPQKQEGAVADKPSG
jgi:hypothetical protein